MNLRGKWGRTTVANKLNALSKSLGATLRQGRDALDASIKASRLDQRAWVGVSQISPGPFRGQYLQAGERFRFDVDILNTGRTPALHVTHQITYRTLARNEAFITSYPTSSTPMGPLHPNARLHWMTPESEIITANNMAAYERGLMWLAYSYQPKGEAVARSAGFVPCASFNAAYRSALELIRNNPLR